MEQVPKFLISQTKSMKMGIDLPENYKFQYRNRVYIAHSCNYCFSVENLLKCASCLSVFYCSKKHQSMDWAFHKPTCMALKEIKNYLPFPENCTEDEFQQYTNKMMIEMGKIRGINEYLLNEYEKQICSFPWLCYVCFKKPSSRYLCKECLSAAYCSEQHKKLDKNHERVCTPLRRYRSFVSLGYLNGSKSPPKQPYYSLKKKVRWPGKKGELIKLLRILPETSDEDEAYIQVNMIFDRYVPAAVIIEALENVRLIKKRNFILKPPKECYSGKKQWLWKKFDKPGNLRNNRTLTIHFAYADSYEFEFQWNSIAQLLTNWIINIDDIEIVLISPFLKDCIIPTDEYNPKIIRFTVHNNFYKDVVFASPPDIIVMFEYQRSLNLAEYDMESLFKYKKVPVILTSATPNLIDHAFNIASSLLNVEILADVYTNDFTDMNPNWIWMKNHGIVALLKNNYYGVYWRIS